MTNVLTEKFGRKVLITVVAHDQLVTITKTRQQTNTPNTHTLSPLTGAWFMVGFIAELSLEVGLGRSPANLGGLHPN